MMKDLTSIVLVNFARLLLLSVFIQLNGCWGLPIKSGEPHQYSDRKDHLETMHGASSAEIISSFGKPDWTVKRKTSTYYVYEWKKNDRQWLWVGYLPSPIVGVVEINWYCILLKLDERDTLVDHKVKVVHDEPYGLRTLPSYVGYANCLDVFYSANGPAFSNRLKYEIGSYCPNADLGHADAQKHIGDIYYFGVYLVDIDLIRAYVWYSLAAVNGDEDAKMLLSEVTSKLTPDQLREAQYNLERWAPGQCKKDLEEDLLDVTKRNGD
jgi:hypothetical protein